MNSPRRTAEVLLLGNLETLEAWRGVHGPTLSRLLDRCELWWDSKGVFLQHRPPHAFEYAVNPFEDIPWDRVLAWLNDQEMPTDGSILYLAVLDGWDHPTYAGWGGIPLVVVGEWFLRVIESVGTPEAIVDDDLGGFLCCHEIGHAMGLPHDFETPDSAMGYGWTAGFNFILGPLWDSVLQKGNILDTAGLALACELRRP